MRASASCTPSKLPIGVRNCLRIRLYPPVAHSRVRRPEPDWAEVYQEHRKPGVTLLLLWEENRSDHPDGYGYSRFCELYRRFTKKRRR